MHKRIRTVLVNGLLLVGLIGLLIAYFVLVGNLPARIYTPAQQEYLSYNYSRSISQVAPIWNMVQPEGVQPGSPVTPFVFPGQESCVRATLAARYENQEGVSVTVYDLDFRGEYYLAHPGPMTTTLELFFPFPSNLETLHEVRFLVDGEEPAGAHYSTRGIHWQTVLGAGAEHQIVISYQADGANSFSYGLHHDQRSDVDIMVTVMGLVGSEVPNASLPPSASETTDEGETFAWNYANLIPDRDIQLTLPTRLSFAQRVAQLQDDFSVLARLAPFLVGLFLASLAGVLYLSSARLRPESYLLTGCGLALFYPTLTYLSGVINVVPAGILALLLVSGLLLRFISLAADSRQIRWRVGLLLLVFLGAFSLGTLTPWRGLLWTGGGLLLIGAFMLLYARPPAARQPVAAPPPAEIPPEPAPVPLPDKTISEPEPVPPPDVITTEPEPVPASDDAPSEPANHFCPYCARALADDHNFCPGCGRDTSPLHRCAGCGYQQFIPAALESVYCLHCGHLLSEKES